MKNLLSVMAVVLTLGLTFGAADAEAKRLGGSKSMGMQRQSSTFDKAPTTPAQAPMANPGMAAKSAVPASAAAPAKRSWMGPIAGLAAGLGLAALASHFGFGEGLANMLMIGLLVMAALAMIGFFMRKRAMTQASAPGSMQYAGAGIGHGAPQPQRTDVPMPGAAGSSVTGIGAGITASPATAAIPAGFDVPAFERVAKVHFIRLQAANDERNPDDIREFTTPEMFAEIKLDMSERGTAAQQTDVMMLEAVLLEVADEPGREIASIRFYGSIRENGGQAEEFDEIWNLVKPRSGNGGWLLAGIQQAGQR